MALNALQFDSAAAASILLRARRGGERPKGLTPFPYDRHAAYTIQEAVISGLDDPGGVWKMGMLGGTRREAAVLPRKNLFHSGARIMVPYQSLIEVETAIIMTDDPGPDANDEQVLAAIGGVHIAFEVVATRFHSGHHASALEQMADSFSSTAVVLGSEIKGWRDGLPDTLGIRLEQDRNHIIAPELPAPFAEALDFIRWLSEHARLYERPLSKNNVIITGARVGPLPLMVEQSVRASALGATTVLNKVHCPT